MAKPIFIKGLRENDETEQAEPETQNTYVLRAVKFVEYSLISCTMCIKIVATLVHVSLELLWLYVYVCAMYIYTLSRRPRNFSPSVCQPLTVIVSHPPTLVYS